jgi:hypothetical protein
MPSVARIAALLTPLQSGVAGGAKTSTVTGSSVDCDGMTGSVVFTQQVDTVSGTTPTLDGKVQESLDGSTNWTDVSGATATQVTASTNVQNIVADRTKRYLRYVGTIAGTSPSFALSVTSHALREYR